MIRFTLIIVVVGFGFHSYSQPELNKKLQKQKAAFDALIENERQYEELISNAERAFENVQYSAARALYKEAIQYNSDNEQWLTSKINDLDILMAERIIRMVDTIENTAIANNPILLERKTHRPNSLIKVAYDTIVEESIPETTIEPEVKEVIAKVKVEERKSTSDKNELVYSVVSDEKAGEKLESYSEYPIGITEEFIDMGNHTIQRVVVVDSLETLTYKRVKHSWGGDFTFKNDLSISERIWLVEVEAFRNKYPKKEE